MDAKPRELYLLFRGYEVCKLSPDWSVPQSIKNEAKMTASLFQGYEGSQLKVTSKNGKTSSVMMFSNTCHIISANNPNVLKQPVGFVTFTTRSEAEAAKQVLQVMNLH